MIGLFPLMILHTFLLIGSCIKNGAVHPETVTMSILIMINNSSPFFSLMRYGCDHYLRFILHHIYTDANIYHVADDCVGLLLWSFMML